MSEPKPAKKTKKIRTKIPKNIAARVQFHSNRTCCVCRDGNKIIQIHHLDENPVNHNEENLAVLCLECHDQTMIKGGFGRKLDSDLIILYRDDWYQIVGKGRVSNDCTHDSYDTLYDANFATSIAEIYRENNDYEALAQHYNLVGSIELRDKYIDIAIKNGCSPETLIYFRGIQKKIDLIPQDVISKRFEELEDKQRIFSRARLNKRLDKHSEAVADYLEGISIRLNEKRYFTVAIYLKELFESGLTERLFEKALLDAEERGDLWWQVRALEELGRYDDSRELILRNENEILKSDESLLFRELIALAKGDRREWLEARKAVARSSI